MTFRAQEIISYWFTDLEPSTPERGRFELWFGKDPKTDREIKQQFEKDLGRAAKGELDIWLASPRTCLALIILLDQFPRNIYRDQARAFAFDPKACAVCQEGLKQEYDAQLPLFGRLFFYLPLEHSENLEHQERSVALFKRLLQDAPEELKPAFKMVFDYAVRHREIILRFGRFPHRNQALGRELTPAEVEFLKEPGSSF